MATRRIGFRWMALAGSLILAGAATGEDRDVVRPPVGRLTGGRPPADDDLPAEWFRAEVNLEKLRAAINRLEERAEYQRAQLRGTEDSLAQLREMATLLEDYERKRHDGWLETLKMLRAQEKACQRYLDRLAADPLPDSKASLGARIHEQEVKLTKGDLERVRTQIKQLEAATAPVEVPQRVEGVLDPVESADFPIPPPSAKPSPSPRR